MRLIAALVVVVVVSIGVFVWFPRPAGNTGQVPTPVPTVAGQTATPVAVQPTVIPVPTVEPTPQSTAAPVPTASPTSVLTPVPATPTVPSVTSPPIPESVVVLHQYLYPKNPAGKYFGLEINKEAVIYAPFAGKIQIVLADSSSNNKIPAGKTYAWLLLTAEEGARSQVKDKTQFSLSLGAVGSDVVLLVKDGDRVAPKDPLVKIVGFGPSFWTYLNDPSVGFQIVGWWRDASYNFVEVDAIAAKAFLKDRSS